MTRDDVRNTILVQSWLSNYDVLLCSCYWSAYPKSGKWTV